MVSRRLLRTEAANEDSKVTPLELFFDLVFVFALTQVTAYLADHLSWHGLVQGLLIIGLLWWGWVCYSWLGNVVRADEGICRMVMFAAMTTMFVASLTIPEAFDDLPGGLSGPVVIALCYFVFRALHIVLFFVIARDDPTLRRQLVRYAPTVVGATALLLVAAALDGPAQTVMWGLALLVDYGGTMLSGSDWRLRSAGHFAERHGLILIVALGESIVAIGVGIAELPISWPIVLAAALGLALSGGLWWIYFDVTSLAAEHALAATPAGEQPRLARDAYSYLHLPMVAGVVLLALGLKKVLEYVGDGAHHELSDPLKGVGLYALFGGVALYLLGHVAFKLRALRTFATARAVAAAAILAAIPLAVRLPALASLGLLVAVVVVLIASEVIRHAEQRAQVRHSHEAG